MSIREPLPAPTAQEPVGTEDGAWIVGVSDVKGGIANPKGLDLPALMKHLAEKRTVAG